MVDFYTNLWGFLCIYLVTYGLMTFPGEVIIFNNKSTYEFFIFIPCYYVVLKPFIKTRCEEYVFTFYASVSSSWNRKVLNTCTKSWRFRIIYLSFIKSRNKTIAVKKRELLTFFRGILFAFVPVHYWRRNGKLCNVQKHFGTAWDDSLRRWSCLNFFYC